MPLSDDTQTIRPFSDSTPPSSSASLIRSSADRLISISSDQRSAGILPSVRSRVTPALWTSTSRPPGEKRSAIARGASSPVISSSIASPPTRCAVARSSSASAGTFRPTTRAPSRARTSAIAAPIPRAAPVTSATRPSIGRSQSSSGCSGLGVTRTICPDTYAERGESRKRTVESIWSSAPGATSTSWTVAPRPTSLPSERVKPSSARWAVAARGVAHARGGVPRTITRPDVSIRRIVGWKKRWSATSCVESAMPVASKTSALKRWSPGASALNTAASRRAAAAAERTGSSRRGAVWAWASCSPRASGSTSRAVPGAAPSRTRPRTTGSPGLWRSSSTGRGSPVRLATKRPTGELTTWPYVSAGMVRFVPPGLALGALEHGDDALAAGRADAHDAAARAALVQRLGEAADDAPAGRGERVPGGERAAVDVQLLDVDRTERLVAAEALAAEHGVGPRLQRAQDLGGERLVDLVEVEIGQRQTGAVEHPRHRVDRRHEQALAAVDVVDGRRLGVGDVGEHRQTVLVRPLLARQQHRRRAVAERRRVAGGQRPVAVARPEDRLQLGELLGRRVRAQVLVALEAEVRLDEAVGEAAGVGGGQALVAARRELVLLLARDAPLERHLRGVLAHRQAGARLLVARDLGDDLARAHARERLEPRAGRLGAVEVEQDLAQVLVDRDRRVGGGVDAARDGRVDLAERDLVGDEDDRLEAGAARLLDVVGRRVGGEAAAEDGLAGEVAIARVLEDRSPDDLAEPLAVQRAAVGEAVEDDGQHVLVGRVRVARVRAGEGDAVRADDGDAAGLRVHGLSVFVGFDGERRAARSRRPGSTVAMSSSAASLAGIAPVRSHQRPSASAAPKSAADSAATSARARRPPRPRGICSSSAAVTRPPRRSRYSSTPRATSPPAGRVSSNSTRHALRSASMNPKNAWMPARSASGGVRVASIAVTTVSSSASPAGRMHARYRRSLLPKYV